MSSTKSGAKSEQLIELVSNEPFAQFHTWYQLAKETADTSPVLDWDPNSMCLATCTEDGKPSNRMVALKSYDQHGFKFTTNYSSRKGKELEGNPYAAATFFWEPLRRCVRIEGHVIKENRREFLETFQRMPISYQAAKICSAQTQPMSAHQQSLHEKVEEFCMKYDDADESVMPEVPEYLGGCIIIPETVEFWQGQPNRIHDRIRFRKIIPSDSLDVGDGNPADNGRIVDEDAVNENVGWIIERLAP